MSRRKTAPVKKADFSDASGSVPWWLLATIAAVAFIAYFHTLHFEFVNDDDVQVLRNPWIRDWSHLGQIFTTDVWRFGDPSRSSNYYRPVHMLLHTLGYSISGLNPYGYHLINLVLHAICSVLTALLSFKVVRSTWPAAAAGLMFALYPAHAESVTWIAGVTDLVCAAFYLGALYVYFDATQSESNWGRMVCALGLFLCALLSKEMAFTFPLAAALLDWSFQRKLRWSYYLGMAGTFVVYLLLRLTALGAFQVSQNEVQFGWLTHLLSVLMLYGDYLAKLIVPHDLNAFHVFTPATLLPAPRVILSLGVLAVFAAGIWFFRKERELLFATGFTLLSVVPVLDISGIGENVFADRYLYIPSIGGSILLCMLALRLWSHVPEQRKRFGAPIGAAVLAMTLGSYSYVLADTTFMWRDPITLYTETLKRSPEATMMANSLGAKYFYRGQYEQAKHWFENALQTGVRNFVRSRNINLFDAYSGLGGIYLQEGETEKALQCFTKADSILPDQVSLLQNLGVVYATMGDYSTALSYYGRALTVNPQSEYTYGDFAALYVKMGRYDEALEYARRALSIRPGFADAYLSLARAYAGKGQIEDGRAAYRSAAALDPSKAELVKSELQKLSAVSNGSRVAPK